MNLAKDYQTCMSSFISLLLAATNVVAICILVLLAGKVGLSI